MYGVAREQRRKRTMHNEWDKASDEKLTGLVSDILAASGAPVSFRPHRVIVLAEAINDAGKMTLITMNTTMPGWVAIGLLEVAMIQAKQAVVEEFYSPEEEGDE